MFDLTLTPEQLEMRDTLRDFAEREMKAVAIHPDRLQPFEKPVMTELLSTNLWRQSVIKSNLPMFI